METEACAGLDGRLVADCTEKLQRWFALLRKVMPDYFFTTFTPEQVQEIMPALLNLGHHSGIQEIRGARYVILIYLKSDSCNLVATARRMREFNIVGAAIHESARKLTINGRAATLVVEYYRVGGDPEPWPERFSRKELLAAYRRRFGRVDTGLDELCTRLNWEAVADLDVERLVERLDCALTAQREDRMRVAVEKLDSGEIRLTMALSNCPQRGFYCKYIECLARHGFKVRRAYLRRVTTQDDPAAMTRMPVSVNTLYLDSGRRSPSLDSPRMQALLAELPMVKWMVGDDLLHRELVLGAGWPLARANLVRAAAEFVHAQFAYVDRHAYSFNDVFRLLVLHEPLLGKMLAFFEVRLDPARRRLGAAAEKAVTKRIREAIAAINTGYREKDALMKNVFSAVLDFIVHIVKTNYYVDGATALSFRLDPGFMDCYRGLGAGYAGAFPADCRPFGVFYFYRCDAIGFQVRFADIARGGWRTVIPREGAHELERSEAHSFAKDDIFKEVFVLAHTQHMKNKDIYEGGSKMICLLELGGRSQLPTLYEMQRAVCRAFLDLINYDDGGRLRHAQVRDLAERREIIEIGPDENMHDAMIEWMAEHAVEQRYCLGGGLISGKSDGGINHKEFGVTSLGVHEFLLRVLAEMKIDPRRDAFSVKISGGPSGDVAGNLLKLLLRAERGRPLYPKLKIVAITDGPAAAFDPTGLDRAALAEMIHRQALDAYPPECLSGEGAYLLFAAPVATPQGEGHRLVTRRGGRNAERLIGRDEFMKIFQENLLVNYADVFLPCGGRPETINLANVETCFPDGQASFSAIVEGANSFISPEARDRLQERGVWIVKDASANKCGVITSSYEVLSGLILTAEEFRAAKPRLAAEIMDRLRELARQEADWLFREFRRTGRKLTELTERLSREINAKNEEVAAYLFRHPELAGDHELLLRHLPPMFAALPAERLDRIPGEYRRAIASVELAARIVYSRAKSLDDEIAAAIR